MQLRLRSLFLVPGAIALAALEGVAIATTRPATFAPELVVQAQYQRGETVRVELANRGTTPVFVLRPNPCSLPFTVHDKGGMPLAIQPPVACIMMLGIPVEVAPGDRVELGTWDQRTHDRCDATSDRCFPAEVLEGRYEVRAAVAASADGSFEQRSAFFWIGNTTNTVLEVERIRAPETALVDAPIVVHIEALVPAGMSYATADVAKSVLQIQCVRAPCYSPTTVTIALHGQPGGEGGRIGVDLDLRPLNPGTVTLRVLSGVRDVRTATIRVAEFPEFPDVPDTHWAWRMVGALAKEGILQGHRDGRFQPQWNVTRAEVAKIVLLASKRDIVTRLPNPFSDLPEHHTLRDALLTAIANGYIEASQATVRPDAPATRFETLKALMDAFGRSPTMVLDLAPAFPDAPTGAEAAYSRAAKDAGIISGNDGRFLPNDPITRAEVAKIVSGLLGLVDR